MIKTDFTTLPSTLYTAAQCRELDRIAIEQHKIPGITLMKRAGRAVLDALLAHWPNPAHITVYCGAGNNAGDGYLVAGLAKQKNLPVTLVQVGDPAQISGDAAAAYAFARQEGVDMAVFANAAPAEKGVIVDALLGTGFAGPLRGTYADAITQINAAGLPVVAVDLPSGLAADTGYVAEQSVAADITVTFVGLKQGLFTGRGPALAGKIVFDGLRVPREAYKKIASSVRRANLTKALASLGPRPADAHKGQFGHVLVVGGDNGMGGAVALAAEAAARCGAGLVSVATREQHIAPLLARRPELMVRAMHTAEDIDPLLAKASLVVIGPGLGQSDWSKQLLKRVLASELPVVVDADALNLIALEEPLQRGDQHKDQDNTQPSKQRNDQHNNQRSNWVLTPHPGEAARLLGCNTAAIAADRFAAAAQLQKKYGGVVVLKGAGSLIAAAQGIAVATAGNPGMATGGMGDVLSGVIGALLAQGLTPAQAAELGVQLHGAAADRAAALGGERGLLAGDLFPQLRALLNSEGVPHAEGARHTGNEA